MSNSVFDAFKSEYKVNMALSGIATSTFSKGKDETFAYLDYDVQKGMKWNMKIYSDEAKTDLLVEVEEQNLSLLAGQSGYVFKDGKTGEELGAWVPTKRFLNIFLWAPYKLIVNQEVVAESPGDGFFKLFIPSFVRELMGRKVFNADKTQLAKISIQSIAGCGVVKMIPTSGSIEDERIAIALAVLAGICGVQDG